jgi:hypothetical protein
MTLGLWTFITITICLALSSCGTRAVTVADPATRPATTPERKPGERVARISGMIQALQSVTVRVPQIPAQNSRLTLAALIPNGSTVHKGDILAEFDQTRPAPLRAPARMSPERVAAARGGAATQNFRTVESWSNPRRGG